MIRVFRAPPLALAALLLLGACDSPLNDGPEIAAPVGNDQSADYVATPAGLRSRACAPEIPEGAVVNREGHLRLRDGSSLQLPTCRDTKGPSINSISSWVENAYYHQPQGQWFTRMEVDWIVPRVPLAPYSGGKYYTFPGLGSSDRILQPVLMFKGSWTIQAWWCGNGQTLCPSSGSKPASPGDLIHGSVVASNCSGGFCTWTITERNVTTNQQVSLSVTDVADFWVAEAGAVEVIGLSNCDEFPMNGVSYSGIQLWDRNGAPFTAPWIDRVVGGLNPQCGYNVTHTATSANLSHNPAGSVTAMGGLVANGTCTGLCSPNPKITAVTASGNSITIKDNYNHTGVMTLTGATASGGLVASDPCTNLCTPNPMITSITAGPGNTIIVRDAANHTGTITLTGATALYGFTGSCTNLCGPTPLTSVIASGANGFTMTDPNGHSGYIRLQ